MLPLWILGALLLIALCWCGARMLLAGRQLGLADDDHAAVPMAPTGSLAAKVDHRLQRTRSALDVLIEPDLELHETRPSTGASRERARTYVVLGTALLGLAVVMLGGMLLLV